ncbi:MAG: HlyD family efflux transporter periplasmic adaptor subunit [Planctomycetota bacterium]
MRFRTTASPPVRTGGVMLGLVVFLALIGVGSWVGYQRFSSPEVTLKADDLILAEVIRGPFDHVVVEQGEIESSSNTELTCQIRLRGISGTQILWVIDEGTKVRKGDKLVELDSSQLEIELKEDRIEVITAEAHMATAVALLEQAQIAREEYLKGVYKTEEKAVLSEIAVAQQEMRKAQLALNSSERLVAKGLVKSLQLEADQFALENARNQLEAAQGRLRVLQDLTKRKMLVQFDSEIDAAQANLSAARAKLLEEQMEVTEIENQIAMCVMYAPTDGVVVHANRYSSRGGTAEFVVEAGAMVRERQPIIRLPDPLQMQVRCKVNESRITLLRRGMPAKIRIDALPDEDLKGRIVKVNRYAEPGSWFSSSIKEYATLVEIIDPPEVIRTGMTAAVEVFVEQVPDAVQVPIQAVYEHGGLTYVLEKMSDTDFVTHEVKINATNDTMANLDSGVEPGATLVLNLREHLSLMDLPEIAQEDNSEFMDLKLDPLPGINDGGFSGNRPTLDGPSERRRQPGRPEMRQPSRDQPGMNRPGGPQRGRDGAPWQGRPQRSETESTSTDKMTNTESPSRPDEPAKVSPNKSIGLSDTEGISTRKAALQPTESIPRSIDAVRNKATPRSTDAIAS